MYHKVMLFEDHGVERVNEMQEAGKTGQKFQRRGVEVEREEAYRRIRLLVLEVHVKQAPQNATARHERLGIGPGLFIR